MKKRQRPSSTFSSLDPPFLTGVHPQRFAGLRYLYETLLKEEPSKKTVTLAIILLFLGVAWLVYVTGGTHYATPHLAYIPIVVAGCLLGPRSGIGAGIAAGLLLGPLMPYDVSANLQQQPINWLIRLGTYGSVGLISGILVSLVRQQHARLRWLDFHSPTTGLPNTKALINDINTNLLERKDNNRYTLLLVQIKNYENIIDALGAGASIEIYKGLAHRLKHIRPRPEQVYALRGNKIAALIRNGEQGLKSYMRSLRRLSHGPLTADDVPIYTDLSVGAVAVGYEAHAADKLVQQANIALNQANQRGSLFVRYAYEDDKVRKQNLNLLARLPSAIQNEELLLEYQPKIDLHSKRVVGAEALVRWQHPQLGRIPPGNFVPLAERTALVHPLTRWIMREAVGYIASLHATDPPLNIAINISPRNLEEPGLFTYLLNLIAEFQVPADHIELEITESAILNSSHKIIATLADLRAQGVKISIDDYGAGYTSLSYLADMPVDCLKIDQVFIRRLLQGQRQRSIVASIIDLAQRLELTTVAEGVEDRQTANVLAEMGCDIAQGFLFCRPLSPSALKIWLLQ